MITKDEIQELLHSTETYRVERTTSTGDMDKFQEAICAFANDLPNSRKNGYLILGAYDNGELSGLKVTDDLLKKIAAIRSNGNILPIPVMSVDRFQFPEGDLLVAEVSPSDLPPVRYRGRTFIRIGPSSRHSYGGRRAHPCRTKDVIHGHLRYHALFGCQTE